MNPLALCYLLSRSTILLGPSPLSLGRFRKRILIGLDGLLENLGEFSLYMEDAELVFGLFKDLMDILRI
jgi:hypothetical protein